VNCRAARCGVACADPVLGELKLADRLPELHALRRVLARLLERRLRHPERPPARLQPPCLNSGEGEIRALTQSTLLADDVLRRDEVVFEV
jgi:hypothetical protein